MSKDEDHTKEGPEDVSTMADLIIPCIRCAKVALEVKKDSFECPHCGFRWEII